MGYHVYVICQAYMCVDKILQEIVCLFEKGGDVMNNKIVIICMYRCMALYVCMHGSLVCVCACTPPTCEYALVCK